MKWTINLLLSFVLAIGMMPSSALAQPPGSLPAFSPGSLPAQSEVDDDAVDDEKRTVEFADVQLAVAVDAQLDEQGIEHTAEGKLIALCASDLAHVSRLDVSNAGIARLDGIEAFTGLVELVAHGNSIKDVTPVQGLAALEHLDLSFNKLAELAGTGNGVIAQLAQLTRLRHLDLSHNAIRGLEGVNRFEQLVHLDLFDNAVRDLTPLSGCTTLAHLDLGENNEHRITPLSGLSALEKLVNLTYLDFSLNNEPDIAAHIGPLKKLRFLQLQGNKITCTDMLAGMTDMHTLILSDNEIGSGEGAAIKPLLEMDKLEELNLQANHLRQADIEAMCPEGGIAWKHLKKLDISRNAQAGQADASSRLLALDRAGSIELGYDYEYVKDFPAPALPRYDGEVPYVTYEDFGARADGTYDDFIAIRNAHRFAELYTYAEGADGKRAHGSACEVRATPGKEYHIYRPYDRGEYYATTDIDWKGATFVVHDEGIENKASRFSPILLIRTTGSGAAGCLSAYNDRVALPGAGGSVEGTVGRESTAVNGSILDAIRTLNAKGYSRYYVTVSNAEKKQYIRSDGANSNDGSDQYDAFIVDANGNLEPGQAVQWDFGKITAASILPMPSANDELTFVRDATFVSRIPEGRNETPYSRTGTGKPSYYERGLVFADCAGLRVSNIKHVVGDGPERDAGQTSGSYSGFIFVRDSADVEIRDCELFARKFRDNSRSTYDFTSNRIVNIALSNVNSNDIRDATRWGVTGTNYCKHVVFDSCSLNNIDAHQGFYDLTVRDCAVGARGFRLTGQGPLTVEGTTVYNEELVSLHGDYGSTWDTLGGWARFIDCTLVYEGTAAQQLVSFSPRFDDESSDPPRTHDFGYDLHYPNNVYIENLTIDESEFDATKWRYPEDRFYIVPNFNGSNAHQLPETYWPKNVVINGIKFVKWENTVGHSPYLKLAHNKEGTLWQADPNLLVANVAVRLGDESALVDKLALRRMLIDGEALEACQSVTVELDAPDVILNSSSARLVHEVEVKKDGAATPEGGTATFGAGWKRTFSEPGFYEVTLKSKEPFNPAWDGERTLKFTIASLDAAQGDSKAASSVKLAAQTKTYTGKALAYSGKVTRSGSGGAVTYAYYSDAACKKAVARANVKNAGTYYVKATVAADDDYEAATSAAARFTIAKAASSVKIAAQKRVFTGKALAYTGKVARSGSSGKVSFAYYSDSKCSKAVKAANVKAAGAYYVRARLAADANHGAATSAAARLTVARAANPMRVSGKTVTVKRAKKKAATVKAASAYKFSRKAAGKLTYSRVAKGSSKWLPKVNAKTGAVTVKAGAPKGKTLSVRVKITARGDANRKPLSKTVTVKVRTR